MDKRLERVFKRSMGAKKIMENMYYSLKNAYVSEHMFKTYAYKYIEIELLSILFFHKHFEVFLLVSGPSQVDSGLCAL